MGKTLFRISLITIFILSACSGSPQLATYIRPNITLDINEKTAILPVEMGDANDLTFSDVLSTELMGKGFNIIERSTVAEIVHESGNDISVLINGEQYLILGQITKVRNLILVNSKVNQSVSSATVTIVDTTDGRISWSGSYLEPSPENPNYIKYDSFIIVARKFSAAFMELVEK